MTASGDDASDDWVGAGRRQPGQEGRRSAAQGRQPPPPALQLGTPSRVPPPAAAVCCKHAVCDKHGVCRIHAHGFHVRANFHQQCLHGIPFAIIRLHFHPHVAEITTMVIYTLRLLQPVAVAYSGQTQNLSSSSSTPYLASTRLLLPRGCRPLEPRIPASRTLPAGRRRDFCYLEVAGLS